jgi:hypothetical protein
MFKTTPKEENMRSLTMITLLASLMFGCVTPTHEGFWYRQGKVLDAAQINECWTTIYIHSANGERKYATECSEKRLDPSQLVYWQKVREYSENGETRLDIRSFDR